MARVSIARLLVVVMSAVVMALALLAALGVGSLYSVRRAYDEELSRTSRAQVAAHGVLAAALVEQAVLRAPGPQGARRRRAGDAYERAVRQARAALRHDAPSAQRLATQIAAQRRARTALADARRSDRHAAEARRVAAGALRATEVAVSGIIARQRRRLDAAGARVARDSRRALLRTAASGALATLAGLAIVWLLVGGMGRPLARLVAATRRVAAHDLETRVQPEGPAELRQLGESFNAMATDLERRRLELEAALFQAEQSSRAKTSFLSRMSHELRTPLNAILGFGQLLEMGDLSPSQRGHLEEILTAGQHLLSLVDEVLEIARADAGSENPSLEVVDLTQLMHEAVDLTCRLAASNEVTVTVETPEAPARAAHADPEAVRQILHHLITNGIKFNRRGGHVRVSSEQRDGFARVAVADTGPGIEADQLPKLFMPFERLGAERAGIDGVGLGLALSRSLAAYTGGRLEVESSPGTGSVFTLELPTQATSSGGRGS